MLARLLTPTQVRIFLQEDQNLHHEHLQREEEALRLSAQAQDQNDYAQAAWFQQQAQLHQDRALYFAPTLGLA